MGPNLIESNKLCFDAYKMIRENEVIYSSESVNSIFVFRVLPASPLFFFVIWTKILKKCITGPTFVAYALFSYTNNIPH